MLIQHREHCLEEEEFQRQLEAQTLSLLQEQQRQHVQLLKQQHVIAIE